MTVDIEYETEIALDVPYEDIIRRTVRAAAEYENCPYEFSVDVVITDDDGIHEMNRQARGIDAPTDVLSFPMIEYPAPADFSCVESDPDSFNPDTGELMLGDIMISAQKVINQAELYGHSRERELAFLVAHSMLHLMGYDHINDDERLIMEDRQEKILQSISILRTNQGETNGEQ